MDVREIGETKGARRKRGNVAKTFDIHTHV
jgi:hypothetical protein